MSYSKIAALISVALMIFVPLTFISDSEGTVAGENEEWGTLQIDEATPVLYDQDGAHLENSTLTLTNTKFENINVMIPVKEIILVGKNEIKTKYEGENGLNIACHGNITISGGELNIDLAHYDSHGIDVKSDDGNTYNLNLKNTKITVNSPEDESGDSCFLELNKYNVVVSNCELYGNNQCYGIDSEGDESTVTIEKSYIQFKSPYKIDAIYASGGITSDSEPKGDLQYIDTDGKETTKWESGKISIISSENGEMTIGELPKTNNDMTPIAIGIFIVLLVLVAVGVYIVNKK